MIRYKPQIWFLFLTQSNMLYSRKDPVYIGTQYPLLVIDHLRFYVPLKNFSLTWRCHHCRWRAAKFRPMIGAQGLWAGAPLLADLFLYSYLYEAEFVQFKSASYLDILLNIDSNGRLTTSLFDKRDDFDCAIVNFPFLCSNDTTFTCLWCVHLPVDSIRKSMFCVWRLFKTRQTTYKKVARLWWFSFKVILRKFNGRYNDLVCDYKLSLAHMLICSIQFVRLSFPYWLTPWGSGLE
jgi:hypothetical protein